MLRYVPSIPTLIRLFYHEWILNFVKFFFCIYWVGHVVFVFPFVSVVYSVLLVICPEVELLGHIVILLLWIFYILVAISKIFFASYSVIGSWGHEAKSIEFCVFLIFISVILKRTCTLESSGELLFFYYFFKDFFDVDHFLSLYWMLQYCFWFMFWSFGPKAYGILAPQPGIEPAPPALEGEVPTSGMPGKSPGSF